LAENIIRKTKHTQKNNIMAGEYRKIIEASKVKNDFKELFKNQPLHNAFKQSIIGNVAITEKFNYVLLRIFKNNNSEKSKFYFDGITNGNLKVVYSFNGKTINYGKEYFKNNGELFFTS
jgi:hypothetical protein